MSNFRLNKLDAWRAICCIGVLWIHCWHLNNSLPISIFGINLAKPLSIIGNGVDFFFVISGFCMYYFYTNKLDKINMQSYGSFILSRAYRILPSFLVALVVYSFTLNLDIYSFERLKLIIINLLTLQNFSSAYEISSHFWSIAVEWHFYIVFPFIVFINLKQKNFITYLSIITIILSLIGVVLLTRNKYYDLQLPVRFVEFSVGIVLAYFYKKANSIKISITNIFIGILLLFIGRLLNVDSVLHYTDSSWIYSITKISGYFLMTSGFALLLYYSISDNSRSFLFLNWKPLVFVGRISYSFYLWHSLALVTSWLLFNNLNWTTIFTPVQSLLLQFTLSFFLTIPISYLSFIFIEKRFKYSAKN